MEYMNGEFIMMGCREEDALHSVSDCAAFIREAGFIPLFSNLIPGFSIEEHTAAAQWWTGDPETDPWVWRQVLASDPDIAYGKFFGRNAGFIARDFFPIFANYRRNGYDFDALFEDELASYRAKKIMDVFELDDENAGRQIMSSEVKELAGFGKGGGEKNFEGVLTDLQMQTYLIAGDFRQKKNKKGVSYGWYIAVMETPETKWGRAHVASAYAEDPLKSWEKITARMKQLCPDAADDRIQKLLGIRYPGVESKPEKKEKKEKKIRLPKEWVIPANPKYYDVESAFEAAEEIEWKQGAGIRKDDTVFIYVAAPVSAILYKCLVTETDIPYEYHDGKVQMKAVMKIKLLKRYQRDRITFAALKSDYGVNAVRGPRGIPEGLSRDL